MSMDKEEQQENYDAAMQEEWNNLSEKEQSEIHSRSQEKKQLEILVKHYANKAKSLEEACDNWIHKVRCFEEKFKKDKFSTIDGRIFVSIEWLQKWCDEHEVNFGTMISLELIKDAEKEVSK